MYVARYNDTAEYRAAVSHEIMQSYIKCPQQDPVCNPDCNHYNPKTGCSRQCPLIAVTLSSEGEDYPIEEKIAPLAFELKRLGVFWPCWSCEGHDNHQGQLWKKPRVWFYGDSVVHIRALTDAVNDLNARGNLSSRWGIVLTHSESMNPLTTFSLEPLEPGTESGVDPLHQDLKVLASELHENFMQACRRLENLGS